MCVRALRLRVHYANCLSSFFSRCFSPSSIALLAFVKRQVLVALDRTRQNTPESWMSPSIVVYRSPDEASVFVIFLLRLWRSTSVYTSLHQVYATYPSLGPLGGFPRKWVLLLGPSLDPFGGMGLHAATAG